MKKLLSIITLTTFAASFPLATFAAEKKKPAPATEAAAETNKKATDKPSDAAETATEPKVISFHGDVAAVDATAKTFTFKNKDGKERVFHVGADAKVMKDEKPAEFGAITVGAYATGSYKKTAEGKLEAQKVSIGPKPEKKAKEGDAKPADAKPADEKPKVGKPEAQPAVPKAN